MKTIITVQHPQSEQHLNRMIGSLADWDLTPLGIEQAHRIGQRLAAELTSPPRLYASDLRRTRHTADILAAHLGVQPIFTPALREFNLGEAIGHTKDWAKAHLQCPVWPGTADWPIDFHAKPFPGAESKAEVWQRLTAFLPQLDSADETIVLVSHDGTLSILFALWLGLPPQALDSLHLAGRSGGVSFLTEAPDGRRTLARLNDMAYISP